MGNRILLLAWKGSAANSWVPLLEAGGLQVFLEESTGKRAWRTAKERGIRVVIIDGSRKAALGMQTGHALRDTAKTRDIPIVWVNASPGGVDEIEKLIQPDCLLLAPTSAQQTLEVAQQLLAKEEDKEDVHSESNLKSPPTAKLHLPNRGAKLAINTATLPAAGSIINPDNYANVFSPPEEGGDTLYPATIVVDDSKTPRRRVEAWQPVGKGEELADTPAECQGGGRDEGD